MISLKATLIKVLQKLKALECTTTDYTATVGTTQYAGWYYATISLATANPSAISVVYSQSNRPAFVQLVNGVTARVYTNQASIDVTIRCLYCPTS